MQDQLHIEAPEPAPEPTPSTDCPDCRGPGASLGSLGSREHFRCRNCGGDFSVAVTPSSDFSVDFKISCV